MDNSHKAMDHSHNSAHVNTDVLDLTLRTKGFFVGVIFYNQLF